MEFVPTAASNICAEGNNFFIANGNLVQPNDVISFWFHGNQRDNYKEKWFPSQGQSQTYIDKVIFEKFNDTLVKALAQELESWKETRLSFVALITVLDQFSRHIYRYKGLALEAPERKLADQLALNAAEELQLEIKTYSAYDIQGGLSLAQYIFSLMPFRHSANEDRLKLLLSNMDVCSNQFEWETELLSRFRKQTVRRLQHIQDRLSAQNAESIVAHEYFDVQLKGPDVVAEMMANKLVSAVSDFLLEHKADTSGVAISLSGGVDSMVIATILHLLCGVNGKLPCRIIAMHIDYANRSESSEEADYVQWYCQKLGIAFNKRVITEATRGVTDRSEYERITRDIRYSFYREVLSETGCHAVMLGHHLGDVQENVISNIMRGSSCLQLSGMESIGMSSGVCVWRPLLNYSKDDIYAFAHKFGVPYFRDTTPSWSTRGKLRNQLVPLLIDMYGTGCLSNLSALAEESDSCRSLVETNIYAPLLDAVQRAPCGLSVNILAFIQQPQCFWREILKQLMHSMGMSMIRDKSVNIFVERLQGKKHHAKNAKTVRSDRISMHGWLELRKNFYVELSEDGWLTVFREGVFEPDLSSEYQVNLPDGSKIEGQSWVVNIGNWMITMSWITATDYENSRVLQKPADLLCGDFQYNLKLSPRCTNLEFMAARTGGRKTSVGKPPDSLVGIDMRLRSGLPLLIPCSKTFGTDEEPVDNNFRGLNLKYHYTEHDTNYF